MPHPIPRGTDAHAVHPAHPVQAGTRTAEMRQLSTGPRPAVGEARIIVADHERLIVTYSASDETVCVLTPPGTDPLAMLRLARLVLDDDRYAELASYLGARPD